MEDNCSPGIIPDDNDQLQFIVSTSVGIEELESLEDFIYPNPFTDVLNFKKALDQAAIITDVNGKMVVKISVGSQRLTLKHFHLGLPTPYWKKDP